MIDKTKITCQYIADREGVELGTIDVEKVTQIRKQYSKFWDTLKNKEANKKALYNQISVEKHQEFIYNSYHYDSPFHGDLTTIYSERGKVVMERTPQGRLYLLKKRVPNFVSFVSFDGQHDVNLLYKGETLITTPDYKEGDEFNYISLGKIECNNYESRANADNLIGAFALLRFQGDRFAMVYLNRTELESARGHASGGKAWSTDFLAMCRKTVTIRCLYSFIDNDFSFSNEHKFYLDLKEEKGGSESYHNDNEDLLDLKQSKIVRSSSLSDLLN